MSVFFVHDVGKGIVSPLDRKFNVRDIPPTEEIQASHRIDEKRESHSEDYRHKEQPPSEQQKFRKATEAVSNYQQNQTDTTQQYGYVRDFMSQPVLTIGDDKSLFDAWKVMERYEIHHLVVLDQQERYCGLLSEKKIVPLLMRDERTSSKNIPLSTFCNEPLLSTHPNTSISDLAPALLEFGLDGIAVYDNQTVIGIITYSDILKIILKALRVRVDA